MKQIKINVIILFVIILAIGATIYTYYNLNQEPAPIDLTYINNTPQCLLNKNIYRNEEIEQFIEQCQNEDNKIEQSQEIGNEIVQFQGMSDEIEQAINEAKAKVATVAAELKPSYTDEDLYWLSMAIAQELGSDWVPDYYQQCVGSVVLNRVKDPGFPDTIYGVLHQPGQYCGFYATPTEKNIANAKYLLENGSILPDGVVFQALFIQGEIYESYYDSVMGNTTYFCYK